ncbi:ABC transporter permease [Solicola sp. PLA-1-18]|uniref:ABC transporter permease n=1 Tax=Solicola sp. PLA-1-18 TaxID=3380532 RepID=UPI003B7604B2
MSTTTTPRSDSRIRTFQHAWLLLALVAVVTVALVRVVTGADQLTAPGTLRAMILSACPILLAALGGLWAERAGVVNIGLEGQMLLGTWGAAFMAYHAGPYAGVVGAAVMGLLGALLHAVATVTFGVDHIVSGVAVNIIGLGAIGFLAKAYFNDLEGGGPRNLSGYDTLPRVTVPGLSDGAQWLSDRHVFGVSDVAALVAAATTGVSLLTILVVVLVVASGWILWRTPFGLRLRSCGEAPQAAETLGVNVIRYKYVAVLVSGTLAGLGGVYLTMVSSSSFTVGQTNGTGYIGLAAMIFGNWRPGGIVIASLMFGYTDGVSLLPAGGLVVHALLLLITVVLAALAVWRLRQGQKITALSIGSIAVLVLAWYLVTDSVPRAFVGMTPYVITLFALAVASQRLRMPAADGKPYRKGQAG